MNYFFVLFCKGDQSQSGERSDGKRSAHAISPDERKAIVEECTVDLVSPVMLSHKYNVTVTAIRGWVKAAGKTLPQKYKFNGSRPDRK